jgi:PAS domain S-box-containing protein
MTLRSKTMTIVGVFFIILIMLLYITSNYILVRGTLIAGLISGIAIMILLETQVISRLRIMSKIIKDISISNDLAQRIHLSGADELTVLGEAINHLLVSLDASAEALLAREGNYRSFLERANEGICIIQDALIKYVNPRLAQITHHTKTEMINLPFQDFILPSEHSRMFMIYERLLQGEPIESINETELIGKNGETIPVEINSDTITYEDAPAVLVFVRDITERRKAEAALKESEERFRSLVQSANDIIFRTDDKGFFTFINPATERISGYSDQETIGRNYVDYVHPDYRNQAAKVLGRQFVKKIPTQYYEFPLVSKEGKTVWLGEHVQLIMDGDKAMGFQAVARDITDRKHTEEVLAEAIKRSELKASELAETVKELRLFNQLSIGRELKMIDLKKEVNDLLKRQGEQPRYSMKSIEEVGNKKISRQENG